MARRKWYGYTVFLKGEKFAGGDPWSFSCRAPDSDEAKLTAARYFQKHRTPMNKTPRTLVSLMSKMTARRAPDR